MYLGKDESVGRSGDRPRGKNRRTMRAERHLAYILGRLERLKPLGGGVLVLEMLEIFS